LWRTTLQQLQALQSAGCDLGQGFLFSRPLSAVAVERFLEDRSNALLVHI
jgi:EAL domain-containing protein (putative c-di-GMP-specific phosphodiesterase class I)